VPTENDQQGYADDQQERSRDDERPRSRGKGEAAPGDRGSQAPEVPRKRALLAPDRASAARRRLDCGLRLSPRLDPSEVLVRKKEGVTGLRHWLRTI
jgi:hypothetical protein